METEEKRPHTREDGLKFLQDMDLEFPPVKDFVVTSSGVVEPIPEDQEERDRFFNENKKFGGV